MPGFTPPAPTKEDIWTYVTRTLTVAMGLVQSELAKGTKTADGTEQDLVSVTGRGKYEGWIDLANMQAGDTVVVKEYVRLKSGGSWRLYATATYTDAQTEPAIHPTRKLSEYGWRVTLQQTAGVNRDYDYEFLKEADA